MNEPATFDLIVEGVTVDPLQVAPPALRLTGLAWPPPDVVVLDGGTTLIKTGRYLTAGNIYRYRVATIGRLIDGRLMHDE
jgi:hypothetical protein